MSSLKIDSQVEPSDSGKALFVPLAATTATGKTGVKYSRCFCSDRNF
jgi:hypothetical protein